MTQESSLSLLKTGRNIFLTGAPGSGKTYTINQYIDYLYGLGITPGLVAPTGIAASHINGATMHSYFGLGIKQSLSDFDIENILEKKPVYDRCKKLKVLIIDEISMVHPETLDSIDRLLKQARFSLKPFGGVQTIFVGDFFQLPPVSKTSDQKFAFESSVWKELDLSICYLEGSQRHEDANLLDVLNDIREGEVSEDSMNALRSCYKRNIGNNMTRLYTHNIDVDRINQETLNSITTAPRTYDAISTGPKTWIEKIYNGSLVQQQLTLKKGAFVMFIKNNPEKGYINGTLGVVEDIDALGRPIVQTHNGEEIKVEKNEWTITDNDGTPKGSIKQLPLRLAWAVTIHKSQGMTLDAAEIDLSKAFEPGQGYVALSRVRSLNGLRLMGLNDIALSINPKVRKIDHNMKTSSDALFVYAEKSLEDLDNRAQEFTERIGGVPGSEKPKATTVTKKPTYTETKELLEEGKDIEEIAHIRKLKPETIFKHIQTIITNDPEIDITHLQPDHKIIELVETAREHIIKNNNHEHFLDDGGIRLRAIYEHLKEKVSYDDIKYALLFIDE